MRKLLLGLIATVLIEIAIFILVGKVVGVFNTLLIIVLTSIFGIFIAKKQGLQSVQNMQKGMAEGVPPGPAIIDTFLIFVGGILLILPGFLTDLLGLALVIPFIRKLFKPALYKWLKKKITKGQVFIIHR